MEDVPEDDRLAELTLADFPGALRIVAEGVSIPVALRLAQELGGTRLWMPERPRPGSALVKAMGQDDAERIAALFGPGRVEIPIGPAAQDRGPARVILDMLREGLSHTEIARAARVHVRTVERYAARLREEPD